MRRTFLAVCAALMLSAVAGTLSAAPTGLPDQVIPQMLGVNIHFAGPSDAEVAKIADAGFRMVRMDFAWTSVEKTEGKYDFSDYDALVASLTAKNVRPLFILDYANPLYESGRPPHTGEGRGAFADFAAAAAARYKDKGVLWEIWNEPNGTQFWSPKPNPEDYTALVKSTAAAIKKADPNAVVIAPAVARFDIPFLKRCMDSGLLKSIDAFSVHPYRTAEPETVLADFNDLRDMIDGYTKDRYIPVISGEWGYSATNVPADRQAQYLVRSFLANSLAGAQFSIWYDWRDDGTDPKNAEHNFGVLKNDGTAKPAFTAVQTLTRELDGCKFVRRMGSKPGEYVLLFKGANGYRIAAWTTDSAGEVTVPAEGAKATVVAMDGAKSESDVTGGKLNLKLSQSPIYVEAGKSDRLGLEESVEIKTALDTRFRLQDQVSFNISNPLAKPLRGEASLTVPGEAKPFTHKFSVSPGKSEQFQFQPVVVWDGRSSLNGQAVVKFEGFDAPVTRTIEMNPAHRISARLSAPVDRMLEVRITSPGGDRVSGKLTFTDVKGLKLAKTSVKYEVESQSVVSIVLEDVPPKEFSLGMELRDGAGKLVFKSPVQKYAIIDNFVDAPLSAAPTAYDLVIDGDNSVEATADAYCMAQDAQYVAVQHMNTCRIRYDSASGKRFFRLVPKPGAALPDNSIELGMWLQGDGRGTMLRCRFVDSTGQVFQPNGFPMDSTQWRYRAMPLDGTDATFWGGAGDGKIHPPLKWDSLILIDPQSAPVHGSVYLGPIMIVSEMQAGDKAKEPAEKPKIEKHKRKWPF